MRKKITIKSHRTPVRNTWVDALEEKYKAVPAAFAIARIFENLAFFNYSKSCKSISPTIKKIEETEAELILNGYRKEVNMFITHLAMDTKLTEVFDLIIG